MCIGLRTVTGRVEPFHIVRGCLKVAIGDKTVPSLVDTGASISAIKKSFLDKLVGLTNPVYMPCSVSVFLADGSCTVSSECVTVSFVIGSTTFRQNFKILEQLSRPIILGVDFLQTYEANISFSDTKSLKQTTQPIVALKSFTIPPFSEATFRAKVVSATHYDITDIGICENWDRGDQQQIPYLVKKTLVTPNEFNDVMMSLLNCSPKYRRIKRGAVVALYVPQNIESLVEIGAPHSAPNVKVDSELYLNDPNVENTMYVKELIRPPKPSCASQANSKMTASQAAEMDLLLERYSDAFVGKDGQLGLTNLVTHNILLKEDAVPFTQAPYRQAPKKRDEMSRAVEEQLRQGVIEPTDTGEWSSPAFLVPKSDGTSRVVIDYRRLNLCTKAQFANIPRIDDTLDLLGQTKPTFFSSFDLQSGFHQVPIREQDRDVTAFTTHEGRYRYKVLAMGMKNSPRCFQSLMDLVLNKVKYKSAFAYMDDVICFSRDFQSHLQHVEEILQLLQKANLKLKRSKCVFGVDSLKYLGFIINEKGITPCNDKVKAILSFPTPRSVRDVRSFCGMAQFYRKFIQNFAGIARPLYDLLKGKVKFGWSPTCQTAFDILKKALTGCDIMVYPDFNRKFFLATDASDISLGATLQQYDDKGNLKPIAFAGRSLKPAEKNYTVTHKELLAVVWSVEYFRVYLESARFMIQTDHAALTFLMKQRHLNQRLIRWQILLNAFDFDICHVKGKLNVIPDAISRRTFDETSTPADKRIDDFLTCMSLSRRVDFDPMVSIIEIEPGQKGDVTVRHAPLQSMMAAGARRDKCVHFDPGPAMVIHFNNQVPALTVIRPGRACLVTPEKGCMRPAIISAVTRSETKSLPHQVVCRKQDAPARTHPVGKVPRGDTPPTKTKPNKRTLKKHKVNPADPLDLSIPSLLKLQKDDPTCVALHGHITSNVLPEDPAMRRWVSVHSEKFVIIQGVILEISLLDTLGKPIGRPVVPEPLQLLILQLYHDSAFAAHPGLAGTITAVKQRFYWYQMNSDIAKYVQSCHKCLSSKRGRNIKPPLTIRDPAPHPFSHICLDTLECTKTKRGNHLIQVVMDQNTRACVCWATNSNTAETLAHEIFDRVFSKHGAPLVLYTDNGSSFISDLFKTICKVAGIKQKFSSAFRPQVQGITERANRSIIARLRTLISGTQDDWDLFLPHVEWAINTVPAYSTGHSPYLLLYGRHLNNIYNVERTVPLIDKPRSVIQQFSQRLKMQRAAERQAFDRLKVVQTKMKLRYDKGARVHNFKEGENVYVFVPRLLRKNTKLKLTPLYHGPFVIVNFTSPVTAILKRLSDAKVFTKSVHISRMKKATLRDFTIFQKNYIVNPDLLPCAEDKLINATQRPRQDTPIRVLASKVKKRLHI